ncbi:MAG: caspase family protein [Armatimonadetes bacterium]|nr:caspase family protein [Armatimonadota bacterium]
MIRRHVLKIGLAIAALSPLGGSPTAAKQTAHPKPEQELRLLVSDMQIVIALDVSRDGKRVLTGSTDSIVRLWDLESESEVLKLVGHTGQVWSVAFASNKTIAVTACDDGTIRRWSLKTGKEISRITLKGGAGKVISVSPDGKRCLANGLRGTAILWDLETAKELMVLDVPNDAVHSVALSLDGTKALTGSVSGPAHFWDLKTGEELFKLDGHRGLSTVVAFSPNGKLALTGNWDKTALLWDLVAKKIVWRLAAHTQMVTSVSFSDDGTKVLTGCADGTARVWSVATGKEITRFSTNNRGVTCGMFLPGGTQAATGGYDKTVRIWSTQTGAEVKALRGYCEGVSSVAVADGGKQVVTGGTEGYFHLWDFGAGMELPRRGLRGEAIPSIAILPQARQVLAGYARGPSKVWNIDTGEVIRELAVGDRGVVKVAVSPDGTKALTGYWEKSVGLWDLASGKELLKIDGLKSWASAVAFSPDGTKAIVGSLTSAYLIDLTNGAKVQTLDQGRNLVLSCVFFPDGKRVLISGSRGSSVIWDLSTGATSHTLSANPDIVFSSAISPDGALALTGGLDGVLRLWDLESGGLRHQFLGHTGRIDAVAFSNGSNFAVTVSSDNSARLWDLSTGKQICALYSFDDGNWAVIDPEGRFDCSDVQSTKGLHWVYEDQAKGVLEPIDLAQFAPYYQEPGLLRKIWKGEKLGPVPKIEDVLLYPKVEQLKVDKGIVSFSLKDQGGGIGKSRVLVDGMEVKEFGPGAKHTFDLSKVLEGRKDARVSVVTYDAKNFLASRSVEVESTVPKESALSKPAKIVAVVGGIETYSSERLKLNYAEDDAIAVAQTLIALAEGLKAPIKISLLCSDPAAKGLPKDKVTVLAPSKANFEKAFLDAAAAASDPLDLYLVYLSGHATALGTPAKYLYLTQEARGGTPEYFSQNSIQKQQAISSDELVSWMGSRNLRAKKRVIVLDTCAAAAAEGVVVAMRNDDPSQARAISAFQSRTGMHAILGCPSDLFSYEAPAYRHGLLTASLLKAIKSQPLGNDASPDAVLVDRLFQFARDETPRMAARLGSRQSPSVIGGDSFPIGFLNDELRKQIPATDPSPVFVRPTLFNPDEGGDTMKLSDALSEALNEMALATRGPGNVAPFAVFSDRSQLPDAYKIQGSYTVSGDSVTLRISLWQNDKRLEPVLTEIKSIKSEAVRDVLSAVKAWMDHRRAPVLSAAKR